MVPGAEAYSEPTYDQNSDRYIGQFDRYMY
jgi:hypothetical protein